MEEKQVQMYQIAKPDESNNKENVVLRALVADPSRHTPLAQHPTPTKNASPEVLTTPMYTIESRYRPIPEKVLPKSTESRLSHIEPDTTEESPIQNPPVTKEAQDTPLFVEQEPSSTIFLEPKIISQPILYSIVGEKTTPIQSEQPVLINEEISSPILYTITGGPLYSTINMTANTVDVSTPVIDESPILYSLVGSPNHRVQIQELIKEVVQIPQQSSPSLYSIVGSPRMQPLIQEPDTQVLPQPQQPTPSLYSVVGSPQLQPLIQEPDKKFLPQLQQPTPSLYSVVGSPQLQPLIQEPNKKVLLQPKQPTPSLYSVVGSPHLQPLQQEPAKKVLLQPQQPTPNLYSVVGSPHLQPLNQEPDKKVLLLPQSSSPSLYSIVGGPTSISRFPEANTVNPPASTQVLKVNPTPILYTIVGETKIPINVPKENHGAPSPVKKQTKDGTMYTIIGDPNTPQTMTFPRKTQPIQLQKQPEAPIPTLYSLVGKPNKPSRENIDTEQTSPVRRKIPPPISVSPRRLSRSFERQSVPEVITRELAPITQPKRKRQAKSKERTIPKSETVFIPVSEDERSPRRRQPRATLQHTSPGQIHRKPFTGAHYDPLQLPDYISPYAYYPSKPYFERTLHPNSLPVLRNNSSKRKSRPTQYEPRHRVERKQPYDPWIPHSLERYPVKPKQTSRLWDYENETQTDNDDDMDELDAFGRKNRYRRIWRREPWVPVW